MTGSQFPGVGRPQESGDSPHLGTSPVWFQRILLATDFRPHSRGALAAAAAVARLFGGSITAMHALPRHAIHGVMGGPDEALDASEVSAAEAKFDALERDAALEGLTLRRHIAHGNVADALATAAAIEPFDLIVAGTSAWQGSMKLLLGSTAENVARKVGVPVLFAGPEATVAPEWQSILLASSLQPGSLRAAQYAIAIAERFQARVMLQHVLPGEPRQPDSIRDAMLDAACQRLRELLPAEADNWCRPEIHVDVGDVAGNILARARANHVNLIVMGVRPGPEHADHQLFSVLADVAREAPCPVLAVPEHFQ